MTLKAVTVYEAQFGAVGYEITPLYHWATDARIERAQELLSVDRWIRRRKGATAG